MRDVARPPSPRQQQVLECMAQGMSNLEIANKLGLTVGTVKIYSVAVRKRVPGLNRFNACHFLARQNQRRQAFKLSAWYGRYGHQLNEQAQKDLRLLLSDYVLELFDTTV